MNVKKGITLDAILAETKSGAVAAMKLFGGISVLMLVFSVLSKLYWNVLGTLFFIVLAVCNIIMSVSAFRKSHNPAYMMREINEFCNKNGILLEDIKTDLAHADNFENVFFGEKFIVFVVSHKIKIALPSDIQTAEPYIQQGSGQPSYYLRLYLKNVKKPVNIPLDLLKTRDSLNLIQNKYLHINVALLKF